MKLPWERDPVQPPKNIYSEQVPPTPIRPPTPEERAKIAHRYHMELNDEEIEVLQTYHLHRETAYVDKREYMAAEAHQKRLSYIQSIIKVVRSVDETNQSV